jgi:hypothetical protein
MRSRDEPSRRVVSPSRCCSALQQRTARLTASDSWLASATAHIAVAASPANDSVCPRCVVTIAPSSWKKSPSVSQTRSAPVTPSAASCSASEVKPVISACSTAAQ